MYFFRMSFFATLQSFSFFCLLHFPASGFQQLKLPFLVSFLLDRNFCSYPSTLSILIFFFTFPFFLQFMVYLRFLKRYYARFLVLILLTLSKSLINCIMVFEKVSCKNAPLLAQTSYFSKTYLPKFLLFLFKYY